jgi:hypothetical protein
MRGGRIPSEFRHHLIHFCGIDGRVGPCHVVARFGASAVVHAPLEDCPGVVTLLTELNARFGGVVQEAVVRDPEGSVPGFVVCESVHAVGLFA